MIDELLKAFDAIRERLRLSPNGSRRNAAGPRRLRDDAHHQIRWVLSDHSIFCAGRQCVCLTA